MERFHANVLWFLLLYKNSSRYQEWCVCMRLHTSFVTHFCAIRGCQLIILSRQMILFCTPRNINTSHSQKTWWMEVYQIADTVCISDCAMICKHGPVSMKWLWMLTFNLSHTWLDILGHPKFVMVINQDTCLRNVSVSPHMSGDSGGSYVQFAV